ncbi:MAG: Rap1a/Tai family immunity protein [Alphaproteobacteria bacterium]
MLKVCAVDSMGREIVEGGKIACQAYISGIVDYHNMLRAMRVVSDMDFCVPNDVGLNELQIRVLAYIYKRVKLHRKFVAAPGVTMALMSLYPC